MNGQRKIVPHDWNAILRAGSYQQRILGSTCRTLEIREFDDRYVGSGWGLQCCGV
jgi:hypothetical protein